MNYFPKELMQVYNKSNRFPHKIPANGKEYLANPKNYNCDENRNVELNSKSLEENKKWSKYISPHIRKMCDILPLNLVRGVFGPHMYAELSFDGKQIGIFGEAHYLEISSLGTRTYGDLTGVIPVSSFVKSILLSNPQKEYDFYIETDFLSRNQIKIDKTFEKNISLHLLDREFEFCLRSNDKKCEYQNLRAHYIDIRALTMQEDKKSLFRTVKNMGNLITAAILYDKILEWYPKIQKQFQNNLYKVRIRYFFIDLIEREYISKEKNFEDEDLAFSEFQIIFVYAVDMYTLGRITKESSSYQKNIIIYAGAAHSMNYLNFFRQNNAIVNILEISQESKRFIDKEPVVRFDERDKQKSSLFNF